MRESPFQTTARLRDRLLASPGFRRWAARFPLTRPVARRRARALFDLCAGFVYSQVLLAWVRFDLSAVLLDHPQSPESLATRARLAPERARTLLDAAASLRLATRRPDGRYALGPLGAALLGNPGISAMVEHHARLYADLADPTALLRENRRDTALAGLWPYAHADDPAALGGEQVAVYSQLMTASQPLIAAEALGAYRFARHRCLLDLGGGEGAFLEAVAARWPHLHLMLFDLPAVAARAQTRLGPRARCFGGDFRRDRLPEGADVIALVRVLHDHDDETVRHLLGAVRRALPEGGRLLIAEPMAGAGGAGRAADAYFGLYLLAMGRGRPRSAATLAEMLRAAGFRRIWRRPTALPVLSSVLVAET